MAWPSRGTLPITILFPVTILSFLHRQSPTMSQELELPADPSQALNALQSASTTGHVVVFKHSPVCPVSHAANHRFNTWLKDQSGNTGLQVARIDVIAQRELARGLVAELDVQHESPQALWFTGGKLRWHGSHGALDADAFESLL